MSVTPESEKTSNPAVYAGVGPVASRAAQRINDLDVPVYSGVMPRNPGKA
jgi:hypothetical protein